MANIVPKCNCQSAIIFYTKFKTFNSRTAKIQTHCTIKLARNITISLVRSARRVATAMHMMLDCGLKQNKPSDHRQGTITCRTSNLRSQTCFSGGHQHCMPGIGVQGRLRVPLPVGIWCLRPEVTISRPCPNSMATACSRQGCVGPALEAAVSRLTASLPICRHS